MSSSGGSKGCEAARDAVTSKLCEGLELAERTGMRFLIGYAHRLLGETTLEANPEQAINHFTKGIAVFQEIKTENELALAYTGYVRLQKKEGNIPQARQYLSRALEVFDRLGTLIEPDKVRK
jgi:tetratricopeptide (TPR) repeat protein